MHVLFSNITYFYGIFIILWYIPLKYNIELTQANWLYICKYLKIVN